MTPSTIQQLASQPLVEGISTLYGIGAAIALGWVSLSNNRQILLSLSQFDNTRMIG